MTEITEHGVTVTYTIRVRMTPGSNPGVPTMKTPIAFLVLGTILVLGLSVGGTFLAYKNFPQEKKLNGNGKILIVGDMLFDRQIRLVGQERGEDLIFSCIKPFLLQADMVVGNLEGPITELASVSAGSVPESPENYRFTFPTTTAEVLQRHNITGVNLGNNHMGNFGEEGIIKTQEYLRRSGVHFFGGLRGETLYEAVIKSENVTIKEHFKGEFGRIREVIKGPDGMLYISTSNKDGRGNPASEDDRIVRINPKKL